MDDLLNRLLEFRDQRNWQQFHTPKNLALSVSVEAGELVEIFQWHRDGEPTTDEIRSRASDEAADILIYLLLLSDALDFNLVDAADKKITRNEERFPVSNSFGIAKPTPVED